MIVIAPRDAVFEKTVSNMQEVAARGGRLILTGDRRAADEAEWRCGACPADARYGRQFRADRLRRADPDARLLHRTSSWVRTPISRATWRNR